MSTVPDMNAMAGTMGYWGIPSATIDWCETNYEVSHFVAEFCNTFTNLCFVIPPLAAAIKLRRLNIESSYLMSLVFLAFVGLGSMAFHATLSYPMQLWDELSMMWSGLFVYYLVIKMLVPPDKVPCYVPLLVLYGLVGDAFYVLAKTPLIHQVLFAILFFATAYQGHLLASRVPNTRHVFYLSFLAFNVGFCFWLVDVHLCSELERVRYGLPAIFRPATQFHAVWHLLTGYSSYCLNLFCIHARLKSLGRDFEFCLDRHVGVFLKESKKN